jgi:DNA-binding SARP family transcriptional activator
MDQVETAIRLLGYPEVRADLLNAAFPKRGFQLAALLACNPQNKMSRLELASFLWDNSDDKSHANLRQLIARMRKALANFEQIFAVEEEFIGLQKTRIPFDFELLREEKTCTVANLLAFHHGEFLGDTTECTAYFQTWLAVERTKLNEQIFKSIGTELYAITRFGSADLHKINAIAEKLISIEPEREATYRLMIEIYSRLGNKDGIEKTKTALTKILNEELGVEPSTETKNVLRRISANQQPSLVTPEAKPTQTPPRVAMLLPEWLIPDAEGQVIVRCLMDDVANELARFATFVILAPHSTFQLESSRDLRPEMDSAYMIGGFVKMENGRKILALRSVATNSAEIVWAGEFALELDELLKSFRLLSSRIAKSLAEGIEAHEAMSNEVCKNRQAYIAYLEGRNSQRHLTLANVRRARKKFLEAADEDHDFGTSKARAAETLFDEWALLGGRDPEILNSAKHLSLEAMRNQPNTAIGYWINGLISLYQRQHDAAIEKFDEAAVLAPNSADLLIEHANTLAHVGECDQAIAKFERAIDLNPLPPDHYWRVGAGIYFGKGDLQETIRTCKNVSDEEGVLRLLAASYGLLGEREAAHKFGKKLKQSYPGQTAAEMVGISPDKDPSVSKRFLDGLNVAGIF